MAGSKWLVLVGVMSFAVGLLASPNRRADRAQPPGERPDAVRVNAGAFAREFSVRRGVGETLTVTPHSVHIDGERAFLGPLADHDSPIFTVALDNGRILIAGTTKQKVNHDEHRVFPVNPHGEPGRRGGDTARHRRHASGVLRRRGECVRSDKGT